MIYWLEMIQLQIKLGKTCANHYNIDWSCLSVIPMTGTTSGHPYDPLAEILRWRRWSQERAWADPRSCSAPWRRETWLWCWPSTLYPSWLKTTWTNQIKKKKKKTLDLINWKVLREFACLLVISTSALARGARLGEEKALKLPVSTLVTRFPL